MASKREPLLGGMRQRAKAEARSRSPAPTAKAKAQPKAVGGMRQRARLDAQITTASSSQEHVQLPDPAGEQSMGPCCEAILDQWFQWQECSAASAIGTRSGCYGCVRSCSNRKLGPPRGQHLQGHGSSPCKRVDHARSVLGKNTNADRSRFSCHRCRHPFHPPTRSDWAGSQAGSIFPQSPGWHGSSAPTEGRDSRSIGHGPCIGGAARHAWRWSASSKVRLNRSSFMEPHAASRGMIGHWFVFLTRSSCVNVPAKVATPSMPPWKSSAGV